jgi:hypothetical protein
MSILLAILSALLWTALALLALLVLLPFRAGASGEVHDGEPAGVVAVDWGFGLLGFALDTERRVTLRLAWIPLRFRMKAKGQKARARHERKPAREEKGREKAGARQRLRAALAERAAFQRIAARLVRALHLRLRAEGRIGIGDPADTALLFAALRALERLPGVELALELDWVEEELELELSADARIWIAELLAVAVGLLLERPNRRALRAAMGWA